MRFPPEFLDELRNRVPLEDVIGRHVRLQKKGREFVGLSPFNKEKSPSFTVVPSKGFYHCFSSGEHGDVISFLMKVEGLTFPEAVEKLAGEAGLRMPEQSPESRQRAQQAADQRGVLEQAADWYVEKLFGPEGRAALSYLRDRGLSLETIRSFRLGFSPDSRSALKDHFCSNGHTERGLVAAGLLIDPQEGNRQTYDRFRGRVMFPIADLRGRIVAFGGRALGDGQPKYLNSPETDLFHKGRNLYGGDIARRAAHDGATVIVTEGYMDVIALHAAGFGGAVAPLGTALTEEQLDLIWRMADEPVLCFDGDKAGQRAAGRALERALPMLKPGKSLRFALLPTGEDPDSLIRREGAGAMKSLLRSATSLSEKLWETEVVGRDIANPERRAAAWQALQALVARIEDPTVRKSFSDSFFQRFWRRGGTRRDRDARPGFKAGSAAAGATSGRLERERLMLAVVLHHPELLSEIAEDLGNVSFSAPDLDNLRQQVLIRAFEGAPLESDRLKDHLIAAGFASAIASVTGDRSLRTVAFARPEADKAEALAGWKHTFRIFQQEALKEEINHAEQRLAAEATPENFRYLLDLRAQELSLLDEDPGDPALQRL